MASCPKRGVLNAGDRPARLAAAVAQLQAAAQPFRPRVMPLATRRPVPASTPMRSGGGVPMSMIGTGRLPPGSAVTGGVTSLGNPGSVPGSAPITHGGLGSNGTSTDYQPGGVSSALAPLGPFISAITDVVSQLTDAVQAITDTISVPGADGGAFLWAVDKLITPYTEPLRIWAPDWMPLLIMAGRIQNVRDYSKPILAGCAVEWNPEPSGEYITVRSIDGLQPNDGQTYLITFLYLGLA